MTPAPSPAELTRRAQALLLLGRHTEALKLAQSALAVDATNPNSLRVLATAHLRLGELDAAVAAARRSLAGSPGDPGALEVLARGLCAAGNLLEAVDVAWQVAEALPDSGPAHALLARIQGAAGRNRGASVEIATALRLAPTDPRVLEDAAVVALGLHEVHRAEQHLRELLRLQPDNWSAHANLGVAALLRHRDVTAARHFLRSLRLHPQQVVGTNLVRVVARAIATAINATAVVASVAMLALSDDPDARMLTMAGIVAAVFAALSALYVAANRTIRGVLRHALPLALGLTGGIAIRFTTPSLRRDPEGTAPPDPAAVAGRAAGALMVGLMVLSGFVGRAATLVALVPLVFCGIVLLAQAAHAARLGFASRV